MPAAAPTPVLRKSRRVVMRSSLLLFSLPQGRTCKGSAASTRGACSQKKHLRLYSGFHDDVAPFRHFAVDTLLHSVGTVSQLLVGQLSVSHGIPPVPDLKDQTQPRRGWEKPCLPATSSASR